MGIGTSIFLIAVGAILAFAVHVTGNTHGIDVNTIGWILMIVGGAGALLSMVFWSSWGGVGSYRHQRTVTQQPGRTVVEDRQI
jgi:Domain of unknown function (DUF6458)